MTESTVNIPRDYDPRMSLKYNPQPQMAESDFYLAAIEQMDSEPSRFGTDMLRFRFRLVGSPTQGTPYTYLWRVPMVQSDIHKLTQVNRALGLPTPSLPRLLAGEDKIQTEDYLGKTAMVFLKAEWYQGKRRSIITEVRPQSQFIALRGLPSSAVAGETL